LVALGGFSESVNRSVLRDARALHAGDIILHSHSEFSPGLMRAVTELTRRGEVEAARVWEFYSVVRGERESAFLLANVKVVERGYPFYGAVALASGRPFAQVLVPGTAVVERGLLDRLHLKVGDRLHVGRATPVIVDVVLQEPDRPVRFFSLGPRVFLPAADLVALDLVRPGSRVEYSMLLAVRERGDIDEVAARVRSQSRPEQERVETYRTAASGVKRFLDNFLFFLGLLGIFTLLLAGIAMQSVLTAFLREQERTVGIMKALGATHRRIVGHYLVLVGLLGLAGTLLGIGSSFASQALLARLFRGVLPPDIQFRVFWGNVLEGLVLGTLVVALFTFLPLTRLRNVRPNSILGKEEAPVRRGMPYALVVSTAFLLFVGFILWRIKDLRLSTYFILGAVLLVLATALVGEAILFLLKRGRLRSFIWRQALRGLFRPGNATRLIVVTLGASLALLFAIYLTEQNLDASFIRSYPPDLPNLFFLDIQPSQKAEFSTMLGIPTQYYPVVRGRVAAINGRRVDPARERQRMGDNLGREFNLTYRDRLLDDEAIIRGKGLYTQSAGGAEVSVLDDVLKMADMSLGDVITFNIQGAPVDARMTSIRTRTQKGIRPFFYFVFPPDVLKDAPQTMFAAVRVERERVSAVEAAIVSRFPNVSVIDVTETIAVFAGVMRRLSAIVRFFTLFSVCAGVLLIISSIFATRLARIQETVYFKVLGARRWIVLKVFALENVILGLISGGLALLTSQTMSWVINTQVFDIPYRLFPGASLLLAASSAVLVVTVGVLASLSILNQSPAAFLRRRADE
jgi:putative ABC transport system permease protein